MRKNKRNTEEQPATYKQRMKAGVESGMRGIIARILVFVVFAWNIICAVQFISTPDAYAASYQLTGVGAQAAVEGMGIVFLMWNVTYPLVILKPSKYRAMFIVVIIQQIIGLFGEVFVLSGLGSNAGVLMGSLLRFIRFDAAGLVLLIIAYALSAPRALARRR